MPKRERKPNANHMRDVAAQVCSCEEIVTSRYIAIARLYEAHHRAALAQTAQEGLFA